MKNKLNAAKLYNDSYNGLFEALSSKDNDGVYAKSQQDLKQLTRVQTVLNYETVTELVAEHKNLDWNRHKPGKTFKMTNKLKNEGVHWKGKSEDLVMDIAMLSLPIGDQTEFAVTMLFAKRSDAVMFKLTYC